MFSSNNSKRWSPASLILMFVTGLICGLVIWALDKDSSKLIRGLFVIIIFFAFTIPDDKNE